MDLGHLGFASVVRVYSRVHDGFVGFTNVSYEPAEEEKELRIPVRFTRPHENTNVVTVRYETEGEPAPNYAPVSGLLTWSPEESGEKNITVPLIDNDTFDGSSVFNIKLRSPISARLDEITNAVIAVRDRRPSVMPANRVELPEGPFVTVLRGEASVTIELDRSYGFDGAVAFTNIWIADDSAVPEIDLQAATNLGVSWKRREGGTCQIVLPLNPEALASNHVRRFAISGAVLLEGETTLDRLTIGVAILPREMRVPITLRKWEFDFALENLRLLANAPQGSVVELLEANDPSGSWLPIREAKVGANVGFEILRENGPARFFSVR